MGGGVYNKVRTILRILHNGVVNGITRWLLMVYACAHPNGLAGKGETTENGLNTFSEFSLFNIILCATACDPVTPTQKTILNGLAQWFTFFRQ